MRWWWRGRQRLSSTHESVTRGAEPHDRRAGATRIVRRYAGVRRWRPGGPARAASGGRAEPGRLPAAYPSALVGGHTAARDARTASPGCGWRPPRPTPASRSGAWTPAQTATCSTAPCLRSASPGLSGGYACCPRSPSIPCHGIARGPFDHAGLESFLTESDGLAAGLLAELVRSRPDRHGFRPCRRPRNELCGDPARAQKCA